MPQHTKDTIRASNCAKNRSKIDQKSIQNRLWNRFRFRDPFRSDFGPILVPTWGHLGGQVGAMLAKKSIFGSSGRHAKTTMISNTIRDPLGTDFGAILGSKIGPRSVSRAIMKQMQRSSKSSAGAVFLRIRGAWNRSKIVLKTMLS